MSIREEYVLPESVKKAAKKFALKKIKKENYVLPESIKKTLEEILKKEKGVRNIKPKEEKL